MSRPLCRDDTNPPLSNWLLKDAPAIKNLPGGSEIPRDCPTQREAARSEGEALRQTEAQAGGQSTIDGQCIDRDPERHLRGR